MVVDHGLGLDAGPRAEAARTSGPGSWLVTVLATAACAGIFRVLNRTRIRRRVVAITPNTLLVANHQSSLDAFLVALATLAPGDWLRPALLPWTPAAAEHFFATPVRAWFAGRLRCIAVAPGRHDPIALRGLVAALRTGVVIVFPEGRRSPDGAPLPAEPGVGALVLATAPRVIPVAIDGTRDVVRFDRFGVRLGRRVGVSVGAPVELAEFHGRALDRVTAQAIADRSMAAIRAELEVARALRERA